MGVASRITPTSRGGLPVPVELQSPGDSNQPPAVTVGGEFYHGQPFEIHCGLLLLIMAHGAVQRVAAGMVVGLVKACAVSLAGFAGNSYNVPSRNRSSNILAAQRAPSTTLGGTIS